MPSVHTEGQLAEKINGERALLVYFSAPGCKVCGVLQPKIEELCLREFPSLSQVYVDCEALPEVAAQRQVFTIPVVLVFFDGREGIRKTRSFGIRELAEAIHRPYGLIFE